MWQELWEAAAPGLIEIVMGIVGLATGYATLLIRRKFGIEIEERHRQRLHEAIRNGLVAMADRGLQGEDMVDAVTDYLRQGVPDALKALKPTDSVLSTLIRAKARDLFEKIG